MINKQNSIISDWLIFIKVVECRGFSCAAKELNRSVSSISKSITKLEDTLRSQLICRSAHKFEITEAGYKTYEKAKSLCTSYHDLLAELSLTDSRIEGTIRLSAPTVLCENILPQWVMNYTTQNSDAVINLNSREGGTFSANSPEFDDLVIKSGYIDSPDLIHKKINSVPFGLYASPDYIADNPKIEHPDDLNMHKILKLLHPSIDGPLCMTNNDNTKVTTLISKPIFSSNNVSSIVNMTVQNRGICLAVPAWAVRDQLKDGSLVEVLPEWSLPNLPSFLVWRYRSSYSMLFKDFKLFIENEWNSFFKE